ncbi:plexin-B2 [Lates japonicus]|uniref:Plexin-B2 n=1 Tax=Lates japonicus TaxID=270547 RepID=A0AAD3MTA6_LATJO|nr:plexin-B2 [Lates japonicus]
MPAECHQKDSAGEPLYKLFRAIKHQIEKGPVDARVKKAKYTLNDTGLLGDDVEYSVLSGCLDQQGRFCQIWTLTSQKEYSDDQYLAHYNNTAVFVDDSSAAALCPGAVKAPAVKYFFDFLDEQALNTTM